jgi:hypothetical protein
MRIQAHLPGIHKALGDCLAALNSHTVSQWHVAQCTGQARQVAEQLARYSDEFARQIDEMAMVAGGDDTADSWQSMLDEALAMRSEVLSRVG